MTDPAAVSPASSRPGGTPPTPRARSIRVLQLVLSLEPGGAERLVIDLTKRLPAPFDPLVCCLDGPGAWAPELEADGIPVLSLHRAPGFRPSLGVRVAALLRRHRVRVLHCHQYSPFVYGCLAKLLSPHVRLVFTEHGRLAGASPSRKRRWVNPLLGLVPGQGFAVCEDLKRHLVREGFPAHRLGVLYNGIEPGPCPSPAHREAARRRLEVSDDALLVGTAARLDPVKDLPTMIAAFAHLRRDVPGARLVILGDGPERERLVGQVLSAGLEGAVSFPGHRADVRELLPALDIYVNSSTYEGVSLTIAEAMAAARPVIATSVGGNPEIVDDGRSGLLVPAREAVALAEALRALARDPERRREYGACGRRIVEERFHFRAMVEGYTRAYLGRRV